MATIVHGPSDTAVSAVRDALSEYETTFPGATAAVYRQNPGSIRVRIVDDRFAGMARSHRHDQVWEFLQQRIGEDALSEISSLLLLPRAELRSSLANLDFEQPLPSHL